MIPAALTLADLHLAQRLYGGELTADATGTRLVGAEVAGTVLTIGPVLGGAS